MNHRRTDPDRRRDRGAAMVEFALIAPILVVLLVGIIEFGRAYNAQISIQGAAREGARALALRNSAADVEGAVRRSSGAADVVAIQQTACPVGSTQTSTSFAAVTVKATFSFNIPFVDLLIEDGDMELDATAQMRCGL